MNNIIKILLCVIIIVIIYGIYNHMFNKTKPDVKKVENFRYDVTPYNTKSKTVKRAIKKVDDSIDLYKTVTEKLRPIKYLNNSQLTATGAQFLLKSGVDKIHNYNIRTGQKREDINKYKDESVIVLPRKYSEIQPIKNYISKLLT